MSVDPLDRLCVDPALALGLVHGDINVEDFHSDIGDLRNGNSSCLQRFCVFW